MGRLEHSDITSFAHVQQGHLQGPACSEAAAEIRASQSAYTKPIHCGLITSVDICVSPGQKFGQNGNRQ